ncbi:MAG: F-type H+-transporting ATPase subunit delta [Arenicella sp.]|jgi:F-type H+-transporting ATPase subunit delta
MADNASIARPYAKAVFDLAQQENAFDAWTTALEQLAVISNDADFNALVSDPRVEGVKVAELLTDLAKDSLPEGGANLIKLLVQNDRVQSLVDINQQYTDLVAKANALVNADVITAKPLTEDQKSSLAAALEKRLGLKVQLEETVDADLIGGAIIKAGDMVIDGSAKGRIEKLTTALMR